MIILTVFSITVLILIVTSTAVNEYVVKLGFTPPRPAPQHSSSQHSDQTGQEGDEH